MTLHEAVAILRRHNEWRRGADGEMVEARHIGLAIDIVCDHIEQSLAMVSKFSATVPPAEAKGE